MPTHNDDEEAEAHIDEMHGRHLERVEGAHGDFLHPGKLLAGSAVVKLEVVVVRGACSEVEWK